MKAKAKHVYEIKRRGSGRSKADDIKTRMVKCLFCGKLWRTDDAETSPARYPDYKVCNNAWCQQCMKDMG